MLGNSKSRQGNNGNQKKFYMGLFNFISELFSDTYTDQKGYKRYKDSGKPVHRYVAEKKNWPEFKARRSCSS
jgi:hypothetical protein